MDGRQAELLVVSSVNDRNVVVFRPCFTAPTFRTFCALGAGLLAQTGRRTVCGMLTGAGPANWKPPGRRARSECVLLAVLSVASFADRDSESEGAIRPSPAPSSHSCRC